MKTFLKDAGFEVAFFLAGLFGALVNTDNHKLKIWQRVLAFISGGLIANYFTPLVFILLNLNGGTKFAIAFAIGFLGMKGVSPLILKATALVKSKIK